jgi:anthranilate phosphoribosyltransferase
VAEKASDIKFGVAMARDAVKSGAAAKALSRLVEVSNA